MTSRLLLDEYPLIILPELACKVGLNEAIVLQQVHYWVEHFRKVKDERHFHDGEWWVYNTIDEWVRNFPFWSKSTVRRAISNLREQGLLVTGNFNSIGSDTTLWYRINYSALEGMSKPFAQNEHAICSKWANGNTIKGADDAENISDSLFRETSETTNVDYSSSLTCQEGGGGLSCLPGKPSPHEGSDEEWGDWDYFEEVLKEVGITFQLKELSHILWEDTFSMHADLGEAEKDIKAAWKDCRTAKKPAGALCSRIRKHEVIRPRKEEEVIVSPYHDEELALLLRSMPPDLPESERY